MSQERPTKEKSKPRARRKPGIRPSTAALIVILVIAAGARFYRLGGKSYWLDEATSVWLAQLGFMPEAQRNALGLGGRIAAMVENNIRHDAHPPAYQILLLLSLETFGESAFAARLPSAAAGVLTVWLLFRLGRVLYGRRVGLAAALLAAVSAHLVYFSQEARLYSFLAFLSAAHTCLLLDCLRLRRRAGPVRWAAYALVGAAGLWTYALYGLALAGHWLFWGLYSPGGRRRFALFAAVQVAIAASFLPWVPHVWEKAETVRKTLAERPQDARPLAAHVVAPALLDSVAGVHLALADASPALPASTGEGRLVFAEVEQGDLFWNLSLPVWAFAGAAVLQGAFRRGRRKVRLYPLALVPIVAVLAMPTPRVHVFEMKHVMFAAPFLILAVAANLGGSGRTFRIGGAMLAVFVAMNVWGSLGYLRPPFEKEPWRQAVADLEASAAPGDPVMFAPGYAPAGYLVYQTKNMPFTTAAALLDAIERDQLPDVPRLWTIELENPVSRPTVEMDAPAGEEGVIEVPAIAAVDVAGPWDIARPPTVYRGYVGAIRVTEFTASKAPAGPGRQTEEGRQ